VARKSRPPTEKARDTPAVRPASGSTFTLLTAAARAMTVAGGRTASLIADNAPQVAIGMLRIANQYFF